MNRASDHATITEIADFIARVRHLSTAGPGAFSPAELAAFHAAKADLFARLEDQHTRAIERPDPSKDTR